MWQKSLFENVTPEEYQQKWLILSRIDVISTNKSVQQTEKNRGAVLFIILTFYYHPHDYEMDAIQGTSSVKMVIADVA